MVISWLCSYIQQASLCCTKLFVENPPLLAALPYRLPPISFQENMFRTIYGSVLVVFCLFRFAGWSVGSSAQLHGCLVYTRHLNRLLLPPCTCGLILILLLLLLPDFPHVNPSFFLSPLLCILSGPPCLPSPSSSYSRSNSYPDPFHSSLPVTPPTSSLTWIMPRDSEVVRVASV